ncbi:glutamate N-acetyltransferase/amino-acid N-acetyltransferase [Bacillus ectoiniformans]|uniref:bifunctional glutamate N-acetyltransferase/amino-acid acetyltransferase ArgJ n=1 Tax=Bacillus ectoiniformans TaxID=1494429 RepID=UPI0019573511|nr:bifunctional glutamate N-acetyltransferase/amino-acid acetyltransferase ArgJ [Bacillus ectoiniformans]MBM7649866.1 glutamate N-acetyltransferase/amino-acid N-acetyltransferase [Bacillus ectoiniformans]
MNHTELFPKGFYSCSKNVGIKDDTLDFTVITSSVRSAAAAMFTKNQFCGAPITVGRKNIADGHLQAFVINSKNANVATGEKGIADVYKITEAAAAELSISAEDILPSSTGIIGVPLPIDKILKGIPGINNELQEGGLDQSAKAIMTTDTYPKIRSYKVGDVTLTGIAKGSGMIEPNMATMLCYFVTDAKIDSDTLNELLKTAVNQSFNMISVDGDTSTSDTVAIMANGLAGEPNLEEFSHALQAMSIELAKEIARDGEGATKLVEVNVEGADDFTTAKSIAKAIVNSPLVKTAIFGQDPNWGRIISTIGNCETPIDTEAATISFGNICVYANSAPILTNQDALQNYLIEKEIQINISLGSGSEQVTVWGCDLSYDYVKINGEYTT